MIKILKEVEILEMENLYLRTENSTLKHVLTAIKKDLEKERSLNLGKYLLV